MKSKKSDINWVIVMMLLALIVLGISIYLINKMVLKPSQNIQTCDGGLGRCSQTGKDCGNNEKAILNPMGGDNCKYCCIKVS